MRRTVIKKINFRLIFSGLLPGFVLAHFFHHLLTALPVPLLPLIRDEFALDYTRAGLVTSVFALASGFSQIPGGWLADRIGRRIMITIGISGVALAGLLVGLSHTYLMMIICLLLMGILAGSYHPSASPLISASVEPAKQGRALGIHLIGGSASHFLAPLLGAGIAAVWGWRGSFIGLAIPALIFGLVFYILISRRSDMKQLEKTARSQLETTQPENNRRQLIMVIMISALTGSLTMSTVSFIPLLMVDRFGVSREAAAATLAIFYFCGMWAATLGGYMSDRVGRIPVLLTSCLATGPVVFLMNVMPYSWSIGVVLVALGIASFTRMPVSEAYIVSHTPQRRRSTMLGIYYFSSQEGSAVLMPLLGYLIDHFGFSASFSIVAGALIVGTLVCSAFLWGKRG